MPPSRRDATKWVTGMNLCRPLVFTRRLNRRRCDEVLCHDPRARCLSWDRHDLAEKRIEVEYVRARRTLYRVRDELGSLERCVDR